MTANPSPIFQPNEWAMKDFTERVRIGTNLYVLQGIGYPLEAQPILGSTPHWRIVDAKRGVLDEGYADLADLARRKPWECGGDLRG